MNNDLIKTNVEERAKLQEQFCNYLKGICSLSRDGLALYGRSSLVSDGRSYWWTGKEEAMFSWNFIKYPSQINCVRVDWYPVNPWSPLELLAKES